MECETSGSRSGFDGHSGRQRIYVTSRGSLGSGTPSHKTLYPKVLASLMLDMKMEILCSLGSSVTFSSQSDVISQKTWLFIAMAR
jgi:hypothetical protein